MTLDTDYVLGTHDEEIARLGREMERRNMSWISFIESDLMEDRLSLTGFDLAWCWRNAGGEPSAVMMTPLVLEIIAEKQ
jgi:hypothetical protein